MGIFGPSDPEDRLRKQARDILHELDSLETQRDRFIEHEEKCRKNPALGDPDAIAGEIVKTSEQMTRLAKELETLDAGIVAEERRRIRRKAA